MSDITKSLMYLAANNNPEFYTIDHVMQWAACALREANARADALQKRVDELTRPTQYHDVDEFYKEEQTP